MSYDNAFYDVIRTGSLASARCVVPRVVELCTPQTVVDVGCGEGWWLSIFAEHGCEVTGIDGDYVNRDQLSISPDRFHPRDLATGVELDATFDLAISLEVAEHLPERRATSFVEDLTSLADVVLFSAAIPGQGGTGHINEQWPSYWVERFNALGWQCSGALRWEFWDNPDVENWYSQNLMLCVPKGQEIADLFRSPLAPMWPVVHPVLYDARRS